MLQKINRGDVYFYNFGFDYDGSVEGKNRPCVIVSNDKGNNFGTTALVAPITTRSKESCKPWQVHYYNGSKSQIILCEQIKTVNISKLYNYQGRLDVLTMRAVDEALAIEFDLNVTQKEQDNTEFLQRLDIALSKITDMHLNKYDKKINEIITNALYTANSYKDRYEQMCNEIIEKVITVTSNKNEDIMKGIDDIKTVFNKNANSLDKILGSLINLYKNINNDKFIPMTKSVMINSDMSFKNNIQQDITNTSDKIKQVNDSKESIKNTSEKNKITRSKYTVEDAQQMLADYYDMPRNVFMNKYQLSDKIQCNNRLTTMRNILKKNGMDYKNIKNHVVVYNINDLSEEEKQAKFAKYLGENKTLAMISNSDFKNTDNISTHSSRRSNWQPAIDYENVQGLLDFIKECNDNSVSYICDKYGLTKKQLSNRKYLITKSLKDRNIPFIMIKKSRKDV